MAFGEAENEHNLGIFRDCLFNAILEKSGPEQKPKQKKLRGRRTSAAGVASGDDSKANIATPDLSQLVDFSDYLVGEIFQNLPEELRSISYQTLQENVLLSDKWSLPLSLGTCEEIAALVPPSVNDSLETYGLIEPPKSDLQSFMSTVTAAYLNAATTPPPAWSATRSSACEICERDWILLTYHHLIPKAVHAKVLKRGWHEEGQLNSVAWLCRACHSFVHRMASNEELAKEWYTVEKICEREDVQRWAEWVSKVRWKKK